MSLELELVKLATTVPAFSAPIAAALNKTLPHTDILKRMAYERVAQDSNKRPFIPYLYWTGPFNSDPGQCARGVSGTKKEDFWFWCTTSSLTASMAWANAIRIAVQSKFDSVPFVNLTTLRITSAIFIDHHPVNKDQVLLTAEEVPLSQAVIGYTFGYQASGN